MDAVPDIHNTAAFVMMVNRSLRVRTCGVGGTNGGTGQRAFTDNKERL